MRRTSFLVAGFLAGVPALVLLPRTPPAVAATPTHTLTVTGTGVGSYPAFDPGVERYAVTTTAATGGTLSVLATTSDPAGVVRVDGRVAPGGAATVTGLGTGDEVSVWIEDSGGVEQHSLVYLPAGFPALETTGPVDGLAAGVVGLTLNTIIDASPRFVTTVDRNGVPTHVLVAPDAYDLKDQPDGSITYAEPTTTPGRTGDATVVLDHQWHVVGHQETGAGLTDTDLHDSILQPDGTRWLLAYVNDGAGEIHSVIQELAADGHELFRWSSDGLQDTSVIPQPATGVWDYAHVNSIKVLPGGDVLASFRNLDAVLRIATSDHDGFASGDVEWTLGGRASDFTFVDDPYDGPCAQHTATMLPDGHVMVFDDGSGLLAGSLCVDPDQPDGPFQPRTQSRVAEWSLDTVAHTATLVRSYAPSGFYTWFMGSAAQLANGNVLVGWAAETDALAQEVAADGTLLWEVALADPQPSPPPISYRASLMRDQDAEPPVVDQVSLAGGSTYAEGQPATVDFRCTDRGGSSLRTCAGDVRPGDRLDTSTPGTHTLHLTATDGAGNSTTVTRSYAVAAAWQPVWSTNRVDKKLRGARVSTSVRLLNGGLRYDAFRVRGTAGNAGFHVRYELGGRDVTRKVVRGRLHTDAVDPGEWLVLKVVVERTARTRHGAHRTFELTAISVADLTRRAATKVVVRAP